MILVTGGRGFVGRHVVRRLHDAGFDARVLSRSVNATGLPTGVGVVCGDLCRPESLPHALEGVQVVVHLAGKVGDHAAKAELLPVNATGSEAMARAALDAGVERFVHVSSAGVYGVGDSLRAFTEESVPNPDTDYGRSKLIGERGVAEVLGGSRVHWVILRPTGVFGADRPSTAGLIRQVRDRRFWFHGPTRVIVHPLYVDDLVKVLQELVSTDQSFSGEIFNIAGDVALDYRDLIDEIGRRVGGGPKQFSVPTPVAAVMGASCRALDRMGLGYPERLGLLGRKILNRSVDISKLQARFGFEPTALGRALDQTIAALG